MAIIYSYPSKGSVASDDLFVISDASDNNKTKKITAQDIANFVDGEVTLQEVLETGSSAIGNTGNSWAGDMSLTQGGNIVLPQIARRFIVDVNGLTGGGSNKTAYLVGDLEIAGNGASDAGDLNMSGSFEVVGNGTIAGNLNMSEATSDIIFSGGTITSTSGFGVGIRPSAGQNIELDTGAGGNITLTGSGTADLIANMGGIIDITSTGNATFSTGTKDYLIADATSGNTTLEGKSTYIYSRGATGSVISIGGTISNTRPDSVMTQAENIFQVKTTTGSSRFYMHGGSGVDTPGINSVSSHSFYDEIRLGGTAATFNDADGSVLTPGVQGDAGTVGQLLASGGAGASASWINQDTLEPSQVCQTVTNKSGGVLNYGDIVSIDPAAPNQPQPDVIKADNTTLLPAVGMVSDVSIANNTEGKITKIGLIPDIDAAQFVGTIPVEGQIVYMAGGADAGKMTVDRPTGATTGIQNVGIITRVNGGGANFDVQVVTIGRTNALPNNDANALFTTNASNLPISTLGKLEVDVANDTILVGDSAGTTDVTINSNGFRGEVKNDTAAGVENLQIGYQSLEQAMAFGGTARSNVAIGIRAMQGLPGGGTPAAGSYNVAVGNDTLNSNQNLFGQVTGNTAIGHQALQGGPTNIADFNTAVGYQSLINLAGVTTGTADDNTAVGAFSLFNVTSGGENTAIGVGSGQAIVTGNQNTFLGHNSGTTVANMSNATAIGQNADVQGINGTALGQDSSVVGNNSVALGKGATAVGPGVVNINVSGVNGPTAVGGLFVTNSTALPPGLQPGDVYVLDAAAPNNATGHNLLCIHP
jgi:hypothetical protein